MDGSEKKLKITVLHDHLGFAGGGERTLLLLADHLGADFITAYHNPRVYPEMTRQMGERFKVLTKRPVHTRGVRFFWLRFLFFSNRELFKNCDIIIASSPASTEAAAFYTPKNCKRLVYTHTTPRRVFDLYETSRSFYPFWLRPAYTVFAWFWKHLYLRSNSRFVFNIANSNNVRQRVKEHTGSDVNAVIWPPILTDKFRFIESGDFYLSFGRVDEAKRIELIVEAFKKMPDKKLIVCSGGPRLEKVKKMSQGHKNITIKGWVSDQELADLVGRCRASIYIPIDEDAGMTHLESNAAGKPYLGVRDGGLAESTRDGETGVLLEKDFTVEDIIAGIAKMTKEWCLSKKDACVKHAQKYSVETFYQKIDKAIGLFSSGRPVLGIDASRWEDPRWPGKHRRTGVEAVSCNIIEEFVKNRKRYNIDLRLYTPRTIQSLPLSIQRVLPGGKGWTRKALNRELKNNPVDCFFTPGFFVPKKAPGESYALIHDVVFKARPDLYSLLEKTRQDITARINIKRSKKIFTVSEASKKDIIKYYKVPEKDVIVAPMGYSARGSFSRVRPARNIVLYIGRIEKKKSVDVLVKAFKRVKSSCLGWRLVLAGSDGFGAGEIKALAGDDKRVEFLGYVSDEEKWRLLSSAKLFVHPSANEGSTIPLFEAMDAGVPIIASNAPVIKEHGGETVEYFKAGSESDLADKIKTIISDKAKQEKMVTAGKERLKKYSWEKMASILLENIRH